MGDVTATRKLEVAKRAPARCAIVVAKDLGMFRRVFVFT